MSFVFINCTAETFTPTRSGGICSWVIGLARVAQKQGITPWVITKASPAPAYEWPKLVQIDYPRMPQNKLASKAIYVQRSLTGWGHVRQKAYNLKVVRAIKKNNLQEMPLLLNNDIELAVYLRRVFPRATLLHQAHNNNPCSEKFRRQFASSVNVSSAVSDACGRWNKEYYGLSDVPTLYSGVDTDAFHPASIPPPGPPMINFVGRTDHSKGPDLLLRAAKLMAPRTKDFRLQILGTNHYGYSVPDAFEQMLSDLSADLRADGIEVDRPGFIDRYALPERLRRAQINVVPSRWDEPFGLITPEGMASGLATVASRTGGTPEIVADAGFLFERDNAEDLASYLEPLILDQTLRRDYARRARVRAEHFTWDRAWDAYRPLIGV